MKFLASFLTFLALISFPSQAENWPEPEKLPASAALPDVLAGAESPAEWRSQRRSEILRLFEHYVYGRSPELPKLKDIRVQTRLKKEMFGGKGILREMVINYPPEGAPPLHLLLALPKQKQPVPAFVGLNFAGNHTCIADPDVWLNEGWIPGRKKGVEDHRATEASRGSEASRWPFELAIERGYAIATLYHGDIDPDFADFSNGIHPHFFLKGIDEPLAGDWGAIGAWAWSLRIAASVLIADPAIDGDRVCVMGHSRNGKTALWAGAQDERFALVVSNQSGCGGAALSRPRRGEKLVNINTNFPHWFNQRFKDFNDREDHLPIDQHQLLALAAPRPVLVCSATGDQWADPEGEFGSCVAAAPAYQLYGFNDFKAASLPPENQLIDSRIGYHIRPGKHGIGAPDWTVFFDFADKHLAH
ncbi:MAG: acetylxylan esterase [Verrucomicrobiota bacterium]